MTDGVSRIKLDGHLPFVEYRKSSNRFFVVYPGLNVELVMGFEYRWTACELALNTYAATPFYTAIPVVPYKTPYPRPWLLYPNKRWLDGSLIEVRSSED